MQQVSLVPCGVLVALALVAGLWGMRPTDAPSRERRTTSPTEQDVPGYRDPGPAPFDHSYAEAHLAVAADFLAAYYADDCARTNALSRFLPPNACISDMTSTDLDLSTVTVDDTQTPTTATVHAEYMTTSGSRETTHTTSLTLEEYFTGGWFVTKMDLGARF